MRYIIDIPPRLDTMINRLLEDKNSSYSSIDQLVRTALTNQLKIEEIESGHMSFEKEKQEGPISLGEEGFKKLINIKSVSDVQTVANPDPSNSETLVLWGQINRILPIKVGLRVLANMVKDAGNDYIDLEEFRAEAADVAREFGFKLKALDNQNRRKQGAKFSTGFPITEKREKIEVSKNRYKAHYLAYKTGKGKFGGALADLHFVNLEGDKIGITEKGLMFAMLNNPLLDFKDMNSDKVLAIEEIDFYLNLINEFPPGEKKFMKDVLKLVEPEEPPREEFNEKVKLLLERIWKKSEITPAMANTMRSGALSRMWELGLVESKRVGKTVVYSLTKKGKEYLKTGGD